MEENTVQEQPIVEITEHADYKAYRKFLFFTDRRRPTAWINWFSAYVFVPAMVTYLLYSSWYYNRIDPVTLVIIVAYLALIIYRLTSPRRYFKRNWGPHHTETKTAFHDARFDFASSGQNSNANGSVSYERVARAYETKSAFYLKFTEKGWGYFPKIFFSDDQALALRDLFIRKFGDKFKQYKQK